MRYLKLFEEYFLLLENYISDKNIENVEGLDIPSEMFAIIGDIKMYFNIKLSGGYILVDFYQKDKDGSKNYSELPIIDRNSMMNRISKILSTAYDSGVLSLISTNNKYQIWGKEEIYKGISFYPKRSSSDLERNLKNNKDSQRTKLYIKFLKEILGDIEVQDEGDLVKINFKNEVRVGGNSFYEDILKIPHIFSIIKNYDLDKYIKSQNLKSSILK